MKTTFTKLSFAFAALLAFNTGLAQADLVPGINYSYDPPGPDGIIENIEVDVCNNESPSAVFFDVSMYLYEPNSGDHWIIGTQSVSSLSGFACYTFTDWDIDINNTSGIPDGVYRLGTWVDSDEDITETDENNNYGLLSGNINYSSSAVGIKNTANAASLLNNASPNPATASTSLSFHIEKAGVTSLTIYDITGKKVCAVVNAELTAGDHSYQADISTLEPGIYFYELVSGKQKSSKKLIVQ
jgi:hypothetical protein